MECLTYQRSLTFRGSTVHLVVTELVLLNVCVCVCVCVQVFCGRYVNQHMVVHKDSTGHMMALSLADLSVWCYQCDSYIDNHVSWQLKFDL